MSSQKQQSSQTVPEGGEVMLLAFQQDRWNWRPLIYVGPPDEPNKASELCVGFWCRSLRKAQVSGLSMYFNQYAKRYGFMHPEDPRRKGDEAPLPYNVIAFRSDDLVYSETCDELPEGVKH